MNETQRQQAEQLANSFMDLHEDLMFIYKHNMVRSTTRINNIIRYAMVGLVVIMLAMLALVFTFTSRMGAITEHMTTMADDMQQMHANFTGVAEHMRTMQGAVARMDAYVEPMPAMFASVGAMGDNMSTMRADLLAVAQSMGNIEGRMRSMGGNLAAMDQKLSDMSGAVGGTARDVNILSRPMSIFPN